MKKRNLYWASTPCRIEDWFIISTSEKKAKYLHADGEGFNREYVRAKLVCEIPDEIFIEHHKKDKSYWPNLSLLEVLGFTIVKSDFPRIISFGKKVYYEGTGLIKITEHHTSKFPGLYVINIIGTNMYKIGYTKDLEGRLKAFRTALPFEIRLRFYVMTEKHKQLEKDIHEMFTPNLIRREWFKLDPNDLKNLSEYFKKLDKRYFHFVDYEYAF